MRVRLLGHVHDADDYVSLPCLHVTEDKVFTLEGWFVSPARPPSPEPPAGAYDFILTEAGRAVTSYPEVGLCIFAPNGPTPPGLARFFYRDENGAMRSFTGRHPWTSATGRYTTWWPSRTA